MSRLLAIVAVLASGISVLLTWRSSERADEAAGIAAVAGAQAAAAKDEVERAHGRAAALEVQMLLLEARVELGAAGPDSAYLLQFADQRARREAAQVKVARALQLVPQSSDALVHWALVNAALGEWEQARSAATAAAENTSNKRAAGVLALILAKAGDPNSR